MLVKLDKRDGIPAAAQFFHLLGGFVDVRTDQDHTAVAVLLRNQLGAGEQGPFRDAAQHSGDSGGTAEQEPFPGAQRPQKRDCKHLDVLIIRAVDDHLSKVFDRQELLGNLVVVHCTQVLERDADNLFRPHRTAGLLRAPVGQR